MEIRLLGPVGVWHADRERALVRLHRRLILAALALAPARPVSKEALVDRVWGDRPPKAALHSLYTHISSLRQVLADLDGGPGRIALRRLPSGYLLEVDPAQVDLHRARQYAAEARSLVSEQADPDPHAVQLLRKACALWRGTPLTGLPGDWAARVRTGLEQEYLAVAVERFTAEVRLGNHPAVVGPLAALLAEHPLVEPLVGLQMLALYQCGQQSDALNLYARTRRQLVTELGAEPGAALRRLHQQILHRDRALDHGSGARELADAQARPATGAPDRPASGSSQLSDQDQRFPFPAQLPLATPTFVGRSRQLASLNALLSAPRTGLVIATIVGAAGVGKTTLAVHWAHTVADRFPDGQLYVNLRGFDPAGQPVNPATAVRAFLDALAMPPAQLPATEEGQRGLYCSLLAGRRVLILLDNARDAEQVRPLLPGAPGCLVIVTSRDRLTGLVATEGARPVALDVLTRVEARRLLERRLGVERVVAEPAAAGEIISQCERLPLALAIAAAGPATRPGVSLAAVADELCRAKPRLDGFAGPDPVTDVRAVFSWSYRSLSPAAARLFRLLGLHPGPETAVPAAASLSGLSTRTVRPLLAELTRTHLVDEPAAGRYALHDLLRAYALELADTHDSAAQRRAALHRLLDHYLHTAHAAALLFHPQRDPIVLPPPQPGVVPERLDSYQAARDWLTDHYPVLLAGLLRAATAGFDTHTWQLAWTIRTFCERRGRWRDMITAHRAALEAAQRTADPIGLAQSYRGLAGGHLRLGDLDAAITYLNRALGRFRQLADREAQARVYLTIGYALGRQGNHADALSHANRALALFRAADNKAGQASALNDLGWYSSRLGRHEEALEHCTQALRMSRLTGSRHGEAHTMDSLGCIHQRLGRHEQAIECFQGALARFRDLEDRYYQADTLTHLGETHRAAGDRAAASAAWHEAATILAELNHSDVDRVRAKLGHLPGP